MDDGTRDVAKSALEAEGAIVSSRAGRLSGNLVGVTAEWSSGDR